MKHMVEREVWNMRFQLNLVEHVYWDDGLPVGLLKIYERVLERLKRVHSLYSDERYMVIRAVMHMVHRHYHMYEHRAATEERGVENFGQHFMTPPTEGELQAEWQWQQEQERALLEAEPGARGSQSEQAAMQPGTSAAVPTTSKSSADASGAKPTKPKGG